jgi:hypothetical protein
MDKDINLREANHIDHGEFSVSILCGLQLAWLIASVLNSQQTKVIGSAAPINAAGP